MIASSLTTLPHIDLSPPDGCHARLDPHDRVRLPIRGRSSLMSGHRGDHPAPHVPERRLPAGSRSAFTLRRRLRPGLEGRPPSRTGRGARRRSGHCTVDSATGPSPRRRRDPRPAVTDGNTPAERLLTSIGFDPVARLDLAPAASRSTARPLRRPCRDVVDGEVARRGQATGTPPAEATGDGRASSGA